MDEKQNNNIRATYEIRCRIMIVVTLRYESGNPLRGQEKPACGSWREIRWIVSHAPQSTGVLYDGGVPRYHTKRATLQLAGKLTHSVRTPPGDR